MDAVQQLVLHAAGKIEEAVDRENERLDEKIRAIESMDGDELEALKERRIQELQRKQQQKLAMRQLGHGEYREISDTKDFFSQCKASPRVVAAFFRTTTWRCQIVDKHLQALAQSHIETKFVKVDAEKNPFLCVRLHIVMMPSIVLIKDGKTEHTIIGFDEFGGSDDFTTEAVEWVLQQHKMLDGEVSAPESPRAAASRSKLTVKAKSLRQEHDDSDDDYDWN